MSRQPSLGKSVAMILQTHEHDQQRIVPERKTRKRHSLNLLTPLRNLMLPLHHHTRIRQRQRNIHNRILHADALMRPAAKHEIILRVLVRAAVLVQPAFGEQTVWLGEDFGIVQGGVGGRDDHAVGGDGVGGGDREGFERFVGDLEDEEQKESVRVEKRGKGRRRLTMVTGGLTLILSFTKAFK